jgi:glycosyltransferase involved in cell wall biosynthesis
LKILLVGDYLNDPCLGSSKVMLKLQSEFQALGHDCDVLFREDLGRFPSNGYLRQALCPAVTAQKVMASIKSRGRYDVVDIASAEGWVFSFLCRTGIFSDSVVISRSNGLEHLNYRRMVDDHRHGLLHKPWQKRIWFPAVRLTQVEASARAAHKLILLNDHDREFVLQRRWKKPEDVVVIPHGVSQQVCTPASNGESVRGQGFLFCGSWTGMKGIDYLASAFNRFVAAGPPLNLTILGGSAPESEIRGAFSQAAQPYLKVLERLPEDFVMQQYRLHDALIFCSTYEGFGMVLVEAMSQGLACIATPVGAGLMVQDGSSGLVVPARNPEALAVAMRKLATNQTLRNRLGEAARKQVATLTWENTALQTLAVYRNAQKKNRIAGHFVTEAAP